MKNLFQTKTFSLIILFIGISFNSISAEIDNAFKFAKESPFADQHILDEHIYK